MIRLLPQFFLCSAEKTNNIEDVDACMTRLLVTFKQIDKVASEQQW
jgi:phosphotransferase system IIB component